MFCPSCKDEFRSGFTRCANCNVDLVDDLATVKDEAAAPPPVNPLRMVDFCGFFSLEEARNARDKLREHDIRGEIAVRESPEESGREEYWLRVDRSRYRQVPAILDEEIETEPATETFTCGDCGHKVSKHEVFCAQCGARFEDG